jgi:AGCS family alanine or glycine:cation symporter
MAGKWEGNSALQPSEVAQGLSLTVESFKSLLTAIPLLQNLVDIVLPLSLALFAYTTVIGQVAFAQINLKFFTKSKLAMIALTLFIVIFSMGIGTYYFVQGKQLGDVLTIADIAVGMLAITNIMFMLTFAKYVTKALKLFEENVKYDAEKIGITDKSNFWNQRKAKEFKNG